LEARLAVFLSYIGVKWEYEPKTFLQEIKGQARLYVPDFFLTNVDGGVWFEVKPSVGAARADDAEARLEFLSDATGQAAYLFSGDWNGLCWHDWATVHQFSGMEGNLSTAGFQSDGKRVTLRHRHSDEAWVEGKSDPELVRNAIRWAQRKISFLTPEKKKARDEWNKKVAEEQDDLIRQWRAQCDAEEK
jgi:hypothetical protein